MAATPSYPPMNGPVALVGPQFCASHPVDVIIAKKAISITHRDFVVTDVNGAVVFKAKGKLLRVRDHIVLLDANGGPLMSMKQKMRKETQCREYFFGEGHFCCDSVCKY